MHLSASRKSNSLPKRFPVGTTYVVEGRGGEHGDLRVFSRYVVLPSGQRINLTDDFTGNFAEFGMVPGTPAPDVEPQWNPKQSEKRPQPCKENHGSRRNRFASGPVDVSDAGRSPPAPHPQSPGVEPRPL